MQRDRHSGHRLFALCVGVLLFGMGLFACGDESGCTQDYDCPGAKVCQVASGECETLQCDADSDCPTAGTQCQDNRCVALPE